MKRVSIIQLAILAPALLLLFSQGASAQAAPDPDTQIASNEAPNAPAPAQQTANTVSEYVRKWHIGADAGVGLDPEIIIVGAHGSFGPFYRNVIFRPGVEFGWGEVTTTFGVNLDVLFTMRDGVGGNGLWRPYFGIGPNFELSHRGFSAEITNDDESTENNGSSTENNESTDTRSRFDFGDTNFNTGLNFIVGARKDRLSFEMRATAYGVSSVRLMVGYNF